MKNMCVCVSLPPFFQAWQTWKGDEMKPIPVSIPFRQVAYFPLAADACIAGFGASWISKGRLQQGHAAFHEQLHLGHGQAKA